MNSCSVPGVRPSLRALGGSSCSSTSISAAPALTGCCLLWVVRHPGLGWGRAFNASATRAQLSESHARSAMEGSRLTASCERDQLQVLIERAAKLACKICEGAQDLASPPALPCSLFWTMLSVIGMRTPCMGAVRRMPGWTHRPRGNGLEAIRTTQGEAVRHGVNQPTTALLGRHSSKCCHSSAKTATYITIGRTPPHLAAPLGPRIPSAARRIVGRHARGSGCWHPV